MSIKSTLTHTHTFPQVKERLYGSSSSSGSRGVLATQLPASKAAVQATKTQKLDEPLSEHVSGKQMHDPKNVVEDGGHGKDLHPAETKNAVKDEGHGKHPAETKNAAEDDGHGEIIHPEEQLKLLGLSLFAITEKGAVLGSGNFGSVYSCKLANGTCAAVKFCKDVNDKIPGIKHYINSGLGDRFRLLNTRGYCVEDGKVGLIYEKGSDVALERTMSASRDRLKKIALQIDRMNQSGYAHNDVALRNVLGNDLIDLGLFQQHGDKVNRFYPGYTTHPEVFKKRTISRFNDLYAFFKLLLWCLGDDEVRNKTTVFRIYEDIQNKRLQRPGEHIFFKYPRHILTRKIAEDAMFSDMEFQDFFCFDGTRYHFHGDFQKQPAVASLNKMEGYTDKYPSWANRKLNSYYFHILSNDSTWKPGGNCSSLLQEFAKDFSELLDFNLLSTRSTFERLAKDQYDTI